MQFGTTLLAAGSPIEHVADQAWKHSPVIWGGHVLSAQIAVMMLAAILLTVVMAAAARRRAFRPVGKGYNLAEVGVVFVRDFIARPALHERTYAFLPHLLTIFYFILFCNLLGMVPLLTISHAIPAMHAVPIGGTPTGNIWTTGALAGMTFLIIVACGVAEQVKHFVHHGRSKVIGWLIGFALYLWSLVPSMPMAIKIPMAFILVPLEFMGVVAKCFALAIRLFANMSAGHILLAVLLGFITTAQHSGAIVYLVGPSSILGSVAINLLELLVAVIQAFIFTFLSALFIGMAVSPHH